MSHTRNVCFTAVVVLVALALFVLPAAGFAQAPAATKVQNVEKPHPVPPSGAATVTTEQLPAPEATKAEGGEKKGEEANPEEEQERHFLQDGAIVKWMSGVTGWSPATSANVFLWLNFSIIFFGIAIPISRKLPVIFRQRAQNLGAAMEEARKATADANTRLSAVEAKLAGLDAEIAKFRTQVEEDSKADEARIKASIEEEKLRIVASAEQELTVAAATARRQLRAYATDLAIVQAREQLQLSPEADKALIAEFVANAGEGGKN